MKEKTACSGQFLTSRLWISRDLLRKGMRMDDQAQKEGEVRGLFGRFHVEEVALTYTIHLEPRGESWVVLKGGEEGPFAKWG